MKHLAIDIGGRESQICMRDGKTRIVEERRVATSRLGPYLRKQQSPCRVVLETCAESFHIADLAQAAGHEAIVVPATLVKALGVGQRGIKNDVRDARMLSEVSCRVLLPSVHIASEQSRYIKTLCSLREGQVKARTLLINTVRGFLRARAIRIRTGAAETFPARVREGGKELPTCVELQLKQLDHMNDGIREFDREVKQLAEQIEVCRRLMTIPGVGPITALRFVAAIDEVERFGDAHAVQSYVGLTPGERSSSDKKRTTGITKAGSPALRRMLIQSAWAARRSRSAGIDPMVQWSLQVEQRRGKRIAVVALARKLAGVMYALWRDGTVYEPTRMLEGRTPPDPAAVTERRTPPNRAAS